MTPHQYPVFEEGQTLTEAELNDLRDFLHERDRLVGRMIGFGVNCGLGGMVKAGATLTIRPGLAVDQFGEPLVLSEERTIALPPTAVTPSYDFIATGPGGFSVVLEATDTIEPAPECGEEGCAGHSELHTRGVALRIVAGRVTGTRMDFSAEPLLSVEPIRLALDSTPINSYPTLRNAIATRLTNGTQPLVDTALIAKLQATSIVSADQAGVKGYKCGWLNMVLFATLDLLRIEALIRLSCDRSTTRPGVVLGWVHQVSSTWVFDCAFRHAWEPPRGFTEAFLGGTCADPAGSFRDELEALLAGYAPPEPVPGGTTPPPVKCPKGSILIGGKCINIYYPPPKIPDHWQIPWEFELLDPKVPIWYPPYERPWKEPWTIYETEQWNRFDDGVIGATDYVGRPGSEVRNVLEGFIAEDGGLADIRVLAPAEAQALDGYLPSGGFSPSDTIVLSVDSAGVVVATGRVAAVRNTRLVGAALPAALGAATAAQAAATELKGLSAGFETRFDAMDQTITGLGGNLTTLQTDFLAYKTSFDPGSFDTRVGTLEQDLKQFGTVQGRIDVLEGKIEIITKVGGGGRPEPRIGGGFADTTAGPHRGIDKALGQGIADFAETTIAAMRSLPSAGNRNFKRYAAAADRAKTELAATAASEAPADEPMVAAATLEMLSTLRTLVKAAGVSPDLGRQLDAQLRELGGLMQ
ncbi:hypothetical protein NIBR502772_11105 [Pseudarthrobacter sp. NIBRBAC000502772]|uniref:hypothetical protein n=1 Tax=Pseudarthrobacter sp. NIBRBAC000502772 TaxID=2590775 RepID=UPI00113267D9|nr:hypothetical protein [Pseudarthrobacter sp. NIBRBAC000502772]QDG66679.1 hypothetical protein NIBR502772_11105 [Pseudarthrobacter sp. NIBRBAC000502772]